MNGPEMHCDPNAYCLLIPETSDFKCECKPGFNGTGKFCTGNDAMPIDFHNSTIIM